MPTMLNTVLVQIRTRIGHTRADTPSRANVKSEDVQLNNVQETSAVGDGGEPENIEVVRNSQDSEKEEVAKEKESNSIQWQYFADLFLIAGAIFVVFAYFIGMICWLR